MKNKRLNTIAGLVLLDIIIKLIVSKYGMGYRIKLFNNMLGFLPFLNQHQLSIFNNELDLGVSLQLLVIFNIAWIIVLVLFYYIMRKKEIKSIYIDLWYLFFLSGCICSLIDKVFYKGSLDYILFFSKICDLKDVYLVIGFMMGILYVISEWRKGNIQWH